MAAFRVSKDVPAYQGLERRQQSRRAPIPQDEREWRMLNLALIGGEQRGSFGRRANDYTFMAGSLHL